MKVKVNSKETEVAEGSKLADLAIQLKLPTQGIAIGLNNKLIPRTDWNTQELHENDSLVIIKAACGG